MEIIAADRQLAEIAARYRAADTLALADAFAAALARTRKADLVTADLEFKAVETEIKVLWLKNPH
uniref:PIN domain-containing protein n=1 Tax=Cephaloticoccus sp. TaxID=1985742 RepID=UPI00404AE15F